MVPESVRKPKHVVELRSLPTFELRINGQPLPLAHRSQRVLVLLAVRGGPVDRAELAGTLWPEVSAARAYSSLRSTLWGLARLGPSPVVAMGTSVQLSSDVRVDVEAARRLAMRIIDRGPGKLSASAALATLRHDFLPSWSEEWLAAEQHHYRQLRLHALEVLSRYLSEHGDHAHAVEAGLLSLAVEPLRESAHRTLMLAHLAEGNRAEAIWQYHRCRELLQTELGLTPSPEMQALLQRALQDGPVNLPDSRTNGVAQAAQVGPRVTEVPAAGRAHDPSDEHPETGTPLSDDRPEQAAAAGS